MRKRPPLEEVGRETWDDGTEIVWVGVPAPYERKPLSYRDDPQTLGVVRIADLIATQRKITRHGIDHYLATPGAPIRVLQTRDGRQYVADGHHRVVAAIVRGDTTLPAIIQHVRE